MDRFSTPKGGGDAWVNCRPGANIGDGTGNFKPRGLVEQGRPDNLETNPDDSRANLAGVPGQNMPNRLIQN